MQSAVCNRCPLWAKCCLTYGGKACHNAAKEAGFEVRPTNFERIKDMSIDEMAEFIATPCECDVDPETDGYVECGNDLCIKRLIKWLESEAEE